MKGNVLFMLTEMMMMNLATDLKSVSGSVSGYHFCFLFWRSQFQIPFRKLTAMKDIPRLFQVLQKCGGTLLQIKQ